MRKKTSGVFETFGSLNFGKPGESRQPFSPVVAMPSVNWR